MGAKTTSTVQLAFPVSDAPQVPPETENSEDPLMLSLKAIGPLARLVTVTVFDFVAGCFTVPKAKESGDTFAGEVVPDTVKGIVYGLEESGLTVNTKLADSLPRTPGVKETASLHD